VVAEIRPLTHAQTVRKEELLGALDSSRELMRAWHAEHRELKEEIAEKEQRCQNLEEVPDAQSKEHQDIIMELKGLS
jgi:hypothetical protein